VCIFISSMVLLVPVVQYIKIRYVCLLYSGESAFIWLYAYVVPSNMKYEVIVLGMSTRGTPFYQLNECKLDLDTSWDTSYQLHLALK
jgi:hypothetical protein